MADEEDARVVSCEAPDAFFGMELDCKSARAAIGSPSFSGDRRRSNGEVLERFRLCVGGDPVVILKGLAGDRIFGMNHGSGMCSPLKCVWFSRRCQPCAGRPRRSAVRSFFPWPTGIGIIVVRIGRLAMSRFRLDIGGLDAACQVGCSAGSSPEEP